MKCFLPVRWKIETKARTSILTKSRYENIISESGQKENVAKFDLIGKDTMQREELLVRVAIMWPRRVLKQTAIPTAKHVYINLPGERPRNRWVLSQHLKQNKDKLRTKYFAISFFFLLKKKSIARKLQLWRWFKGSGNLMFTTCSLYTGTCRNILSLRFTLLGQTLTHALPAYTIICVFYFSWCVVPDSKSEKPDNEGLFVTAVYRNKSMFCWLHCQQEYQ